MRRGVILSVAALCALAAVLGLRLGGPPSEGEILPLIVARYLDLAGEGAAATDCAAVPGEGAVRMVVTCRARGNAGWAFDVDANGVVIRETILTEPEA